MENREAALRRIWQRARADTDRATGHYNAVKRNIESGAFTGDDLFRLNARLILLEIAIKETEDIQAEAWQALKDAGYVTPHDPNDITG